MQTNLQLLLLVFVFPSANSIIGASSTSSRDVFAMSKEWAEQQGIVMHESLQWKQYGGSVANEESNWGLELQEAVLPGTILLEVPRNLVLDADGIHEEFIVSDGEENLERALGQLADFRIHTEGFLIFLKLLRCSKDGDSQWSSWIQALPKKFPQFSEAEKECLPFYAKYAADYQDKKYQAFCRAAAALGDWKEDELKWAFHAVGSRCWKTAPSNESEAPNTELVPVGDMFNHREPPNVAITHDGGCVKFVYKGNAEEKDLFITYGQPSNPHRFLVIFGFVPEDMTHVWSHIAYPDNPFSVDVSKMVFRAADGMIPKVVWDAVLFALLQPPPKGTPLEYTKQQHIKYKKFTLDILKNHVAKQLEELAVLRKKVETTEGVNMDLIRQHNEFLTTVFSRVQARLENDDGDLYED